MTLRRTPKPSALAHASAAALVALTLAACGGGGGEAPPQQPGNVVVPAAPVVTITNNVTAEVATGAITFAFSFNRDVGTSFTADDITATGGTKGAFTRISGTAATLVVTPTANSTGTVTISIAASAVTDATGTGNAAVTAQKAFNTVPPAPPPPATGTVVLANFDAITPAVVAGFEGAEGSALEAGPAGGGTGRSFKVLRSGGQPYALGIIETTVPLTATRRTVVAQVYSPTAGIPMALKLEGPGGANTGDTQANETVVVGWQTLSWTLNVDATKTYNKIVLLPNLGTVDAAPGKAYFFDSIELRENAPPPAAGTVLANFDDVTPAVVAGFDGAEGSAVENGPAGGGSGKSFKVLRSGGQAYALGIIETPVALSATRRTITAKVHSPTVGIPMALKIEGPAGANTGDTQANETVVAGWQTLSWTLNVDATKTYNKIVLLPNLGTVDAAPGKAYYYDDITLEGAAASGGGGNSGGGSGPLTFSTGFGTGNRTIQGGEYGGFSGSNFDNFTCDGLPINCGGGGEFAPAKSAADSYFYYYYSTATPASAMYMGVFVQAPGLVGGFVPTADAPGVQVGSQTTLKFKLGQNEQWFNSSTKNFMIVVDLGKRYPPNGNTCRLQLRRVVTPTAAAATDYAIPLSSFSVVQDCGAGVTTAAQALAASPISQIAFQGVGGSNELSDGVRTSGANRSVLNGENRYATTIVLQGGITID